MLNKKTVSTSCGRENISKSLYQLHARNAQLVRNKRQNLETEVWNATRCFLYMKIDTMFFYGSATNHLEVGIWVGQLVCLSVSTQMSKQAIFVEASKLIIAWFTSHHASCLKITSKIKTTSKIKMTSKIDLGPRQSHSLGTQEIFLGSLWVT